MTNQLGRALATFQSFKETAAEQKYSREDEGVLLFVVTDTATDFANWQHWSSAASYHNMQGIVERRSCKKSDLPIVHGSVPIPLHCWKVKHHGVQIFSLESPNFWIAAVLFTLVVGPLSMCS